MRILRRELKIKASRAFRDNTLLDKLTEAERQEAAEYYREVAREVTGRLSELARLYNLERVKFLRGEVGRIAPRAPDFAEEIGYGNS